MGSDLKLNILFLFLDGPENYGKLKQNCAHDLDNIIKKKALEVSMSRSETGYTTWGKLRQSSTSQRYVFTAILNVRKYLSFTLTFTHKHCVRRHSLFHLVSHLLIIRFLNGNNTIINKITKHAPHCFVRKSLSMPNLKATGNQQLTNTHQLNVSQAVSNTSNDSFAKMRTLLPMYPIPMTNDSGSNSPAVLQNSSLR
jgi:hypothetical protein